MAKPHRKANPKALKDVVVRMLIPAAQKAALVGAATRQGLALSQWLRRIALLEADLLPDAGAR